MDKKLISRLVDIESLGFSKKQSTNCKKTLAKFSDELTGKAFSCGSGGGFFHMFFQLEDKTWLGFHNADGGITLSKPFKTSKSLYTAFWNDEGKKVFIPYKPKK